MARFSDYRDRFEHIRLERDGGILTLTFHSQGDSLRWNRQAYEECTSAFQEIGSDAENLVIVMTGAGDEFSGPRGFKPAVGKGPDAYEKLVFHQHCKDMLTNLLRIEMPVIAAVNGPALRHAEIPMLSDIILLSETASFQDSSHILSGLAPGDGQNIILPMAIGINRARYYLLTGQEISARDAERYGLANEVMPAEALMPRAMELATMLAQKPPAVLRATRLIMVEQIKRNMLAYFEHGLSLEALARE